MKIIELAGTGESDGTLTVTTTEKIVGFLQKIEMIYDDGATGSTLTFTVEGPVSQPILTVSAAGTADLTWYPRTLANQPTGAAAFTNVAEKMFIVGQPKLTVASGGTSKNFRFLVYVSDE
jgi:hypothetical protein